MTNSTTVGSVIGERNQTAAATFRCI